MSSNENLILKENPTLNDFHQYVRDMEEIRGFSKQTILDKCLMLGEEIGELFKAIRKEKGIKVDNEGSEFGEISDELADILIFILAIANRFDINLEDAFREKEKKNKQRTWK